MIGDAGMPVPKGVEIVDLVLAEGIPSFEQVLDSVLDEAQVEGYTLAAEIQDANPRLQAYIKERLPGIPAEYIPHDDLKQMTKACKFAIRTGGFSPYPNIILRAGVVF